MLKHLMVWWYITLWPQNTIWIPPKSFIHYPQSSQTVVWPKLPKFITNSKLIKIFWNLHLWHICIKVVSIKNDKHEKNNLLTIHSQRWGTMWVDPCLSTPIRYLWTINQPSVVQMISNLAQACTVACQLMFASCPANLVWNFWEIHANTQI